MPRRGPITIVICELARRLGAQHRGFEMSEWEIIEETLRLSGLPADRRLRPGTLARLRAALRGGAFPQRLRPSRRQVPFQAGLEGRGRRPCQDAGPARPCRADRCRRRASIPSAWWRRPARQFLNSTFTETPGSRAREGRPTVHDPSRRLRAPRPSPTATACAWATGAASIVLHARAFDGLQPGVVVVESIWPNGAFEEGIGINTLTSADAGPPKGGAVFHDTAIWIRDGVSRPLRRRRPPQAADHRSRATRRAARANRPRPCM